MTDTEARVALAAALAEAQQALMDALSWMDPDTARKFQQEASYKRIAARIAAGTGGTDD
jgi:ribosomal protein S12 methylthiotransferase accessory factor YcaO